MRIPKKIVILTFAIVVLVIGGATCARAITTNLLPVADTALRDPFPDDNFGSATSLQVGIAKAGQSSRNRCLFKFDLTGIPTNAIINSVTFNLTVTLNPTSAANFDLNRMLVGWGELEATWNSAFDSTPWAAGGGQAGTDYRTLPSSTATLQSGANTFNSAGLMADVEAWRNNPGANFGWMLMASGEPAGTGKQVASREDAVNRPVLTIEYTLPTPPTPPNIFGLALNGNEIRFSFNAESNQTYTVEFCDSLTVGDWGLLTNIPAQPADGVINITNIISSDERYFRARRP